jgi:hypothetical protein
MTTFTRAEPGQNLFFLSAAIVPPQPYSIAFWVEDTATVLSDSLSLAASWEMANGIYLFLKAYPDDAASIATLNDRIQEFLLTPAVRNARFLWVENPIDPVFQWKFQVVTLDETSAVERLTFLDFRNYRLAIARGVTCHIREDRFVFSLNPALHRLPGIDAIEPSKDDPFYFTTDYGANALKNVNVNQSGEGVELFLAAELAGCIHFGLTLQNPAGETAFTELEQMDISLRMFFKADNPVLDPNDPFSGFADLNTADRFLVSDHRYPFLGEDSQSTLHYSRQVDQSQNLTLYATLDPLQPLNDQRSYFAFLAPGDWDTSFM